MVGLQNCTGGNATQTPLILRSQITSWIDMLDKYSLVFFLKLLRQKTLQGSTGNFA